MTRQILNNILEAIGGTPLIKLNRVIKVGGATVAAKLESRNPGGSVKDRPALAMVLDAEKKGILKHGSTLVEPTSGNTGIGLAMVCAVKGYKLVLVMPDNMSLERRKLARIYGAELIVTPAAEKMAACVKKAEELVKENGYIMLQQFKNRANPKVHKAITAKEIWRDTKGKVDILVAGVGTGGTITGLAQTLRKKNPAIQIIGVEPAGSPVLSGGQAGTHQIQGIGPGFVPEILKKELLSEIKQVSDNDAITMARRLAMEEGILAGISSGAAVHVASVISEKPENKGKLIVVILADTGERYLSTAMFEGIE